MKAAEEISQLLDDHIVMTQAMSFSPYKKPFENRIMNWESKLRMTQDVMEEWATCQRAWLYLEPIFSSEDINRSVRILLRHVFSQYSQVIGQVKNRDSGVAFRVQAVSVTLVDIARVCEIRECSCSFFRIFGINLRSCL